MKRKSLDDPAPSPTGGTGKSGRDPTTGRFLKGNRAAAGNPHASRAQRLRTALLEAVEPEDIRMVIRTLVSRARGGDVRAARLLLDRVFGRIPQAGEMEVEDDYDPDWSFL